MIRQTVTQHRDNDAFKREYRASDHDADGRLQSLSSGSSNLVLLRKASCACGGGCPACRAKSDLKVSQPNDPAEIEADQIADKVMRMPVNESAPIKNPVNPSAIHRKCDACEDEEETIQRKPLPSGGGIPSQSPAHVQNALGSGGRELDLQTRNFFEPRLGYDLSSVRIHTGLVAAQSAKTVNALAYTLGNNIVFNENRYCPETETGKHLLAHELAHTIQKNGRINRQDDMDAGVRDAGTPDPRDAGAPTPAVTYPSDEPVDRPDVRQILCVIRMGGCASTRSGGLPTPEEIANYNVTCRRETSYSGGDLTPSDEQCRNPPQLPSSSLVFARSLATLYPGWLGVLPNCPCTDALARSSSDWSGPGACQPPYHIGAATGYRSSSGYASVSGTNHGQQCCYDPAGLLITEGAGAGTPDLVQAPSGAGAAIWGTLPFTSTPGLPSAASHYLNDVVPFNDLGWEIYNRYWVPNNGNNCPSNRKP